MDKLILFGQGCISNYNLSRGISVDVFVENLINSPVDTWRQRGGLKLVSQAPGVVNKIFQDRNTLDLYTTSGTKLFVKTSMGTWQEVFKGLPNTKYQQIINFIDKIFFIDSNDDVRILDTITKVVSYATYSPKKYLTATNALTVQDGSPIMTIRVGKHGLNPTDVITLENFSVSYGEQAINRQNLPLTIVDANTIQLTYPQNFVVSQAPFELVDSGGAGQIIATSLPVNYPKAKLMVQFQNQLYLSGNPSFPTRLYQSNIVSPSSSVNDITFDTGDSFTDIVNLTSALSSGTKTIDVDPTKYGKITALHSSTFGVYISKELGIYFYQGGSEDYPIPILVNEGVVNPNAIDSNGGYTYFCGKNNLYRVKAGNIIVEPIGTPHEYYIKNKIIENTSIKCWDDKVFLTLGNINKLGTPIERVEMLNTDSPNLINIEEITLVLDEKNSKYFFFSNFNPNDFEVVIKKGATDFDTSLSLYLDKGTNIVEYDLNYSKDLNKNFPKRIITHLRYGSYDQRVKFTEVAIFGNRMTNLKVFYNVMGSKSVLWKEAKFKELESDGNRMTFSITEGNVGRAIMFYIGSFDNAENVELHGYTYKIEAA